MELSETKKEKMKKVHTDYMDTEIEHPLLTKIITLFGVMFVVMCSTVIFDMFYEFTVFNLLFNKADWQNTMTVWGYGSVVEGTGGQIVLLEIFDNVNWFGVQPYGLVCFVFTSLFLLTLFAVIYVIMIYVKLYALVIKGLVSTFRISTKKATAELKTNLKESGEILGIKPLPKKEKEHKIKKAKKSKKDKDVEIADEYSDADLDAMLTDPSTAPKIVTSPKVTEEVNKNVVDDSESNPNDISNQSFLN